MKKLILSFLASMTILLGGMGLVAYASPITPPTGGGTGIGTTTSANNGMCLTQTGVFTYGFAACGLGGGGSSTVLYGVSPISVSALVNGNQTSSCPTCATTPGSTSTYLAVFDAANGITGLCSPHLQLLDANLRGGHGNLYGRPLRRHSTRLSPPQERLPCRTDRRVSASNVSF